MKGLKLIMSVVLVVSLLFPTFSLGTIFADESAMKSTVSAETQSILIDNNDSFIESNEQKLINQSTTSLLKNQVANNQALLTLDSNNNYYVETSIISQEIRVNTNFEYERMLVSYMSTDGVNLVSESFERMGTNKQEVVNIEFVPTNQMMNPNIDFMEIQEDHVIMDVSFCNESKVVLTESVEMWILSTPYGVFTSTLDSLTNNLNYIRYLFDNHVIDAAEFEELDVKLHCFNLANKYTIFKYKASECNDQLSSKSKDLIIKSRLYKYAVSDGGYIVLGSTATSTYADYVEVEYDITALNSGDDLKVSGYVYWYDSDYNKHPAQNVSVDIMDDEPSAMDELITTVYTSESGYFTSTFTNYMDENGGDIYLKLYATNVTSMDTVSYYFATTTIWNIMTTYSNCYAAATSGSNIAKSFSIANALYYGRKYEKYINGGTIINNVTTLARFPFMLSNTSGSLPILDSGLIFIAEDDYDNWDTILHEYGHSVQDRLEIFDVELTCLLTGEGFGHSELWNLADYYEGFKGTALATAWNEGWASYFSLCVQRHYDLPSFMYPHTSLTTIWTSDLVNANGYGEDHEVAISSTLTQLVTRNVYTQSQLWTIVKTNRPSSFNSLMELVYEDLLSDKSYHKLKLVGDILERNNIAAKTTNTTLRTSLPSFSWSAPTLTANHYTTSQPYQYNYKYYVVVFDLNFNVLKRWSVPSSQTSYTPTASNWNSIIFNNPSGVYWTVATYEASHSSSGEYYSYFNLLTFSKQTLNISSNNRYTEKIVNLTAGRFRDYHITFAAGGNNVIQTFGTRDAYLELYDASGKQLITDDDDGYKTNALISYNFSANTEYIVRVRYYFTSTSGEVKLSIIPTYHHDNYESAYGPYQKVKASWNLPLQTAALFRYQFDAAGNVTFETSSEADTYLYLIDPLSTEPIEQFNGSNSTAACLYDDDSAGELQSRITKTVEADKEYLAIISFYNPTTTSGDFSITSR